MKTFISVFLLLLAAGPLSAQSRKVLLERQKLQIERLRASVDSLQTLLDSLRSGAFTAEIPAEEPAEPDFGFAADTMSLQKTDSLLGEWYRRRRFSVPEYDMDAVHFTSDVPDAELERRLAAMNSFITLPFNWTVKNYMLLYSEKMRGGMPLLLGRARYYFPVFEEILARYALPLELKYLAVVESRLDPLARSRAGAVGMWQFMYGTARGYGLKVNSFVDERLDAEKSADAAARYLRDAYALFGDWNLAICSYNCGAANVQKAIKRSGSRKFWDIYPYLPRETRGYVPAFVGAMYAFRYHREYGLEPAPIGMPALCDTFVIRRNLHFRQISETAGVPVEVLKSLNPQYTHDIIPGSGGEQILRLPYRWSDAFMAVHPDSLYSHRAGELLSPQLLKNISESGREVRVVYRVKKGDVLGRIALRNGVKVSEIKKWNHLRSDNIRIGQILYLYKKK